MLGREDAELAESLSRLCVLRTEDYQLLKSIRKTQRQKPDPDYLGLLLGEFRKREKWRSDREVELLSQLGAWEYGYYTETRYTEGMAWREMGQFQPVYLECIKATYHLEARDLQESPFATMDSSTFLYSCEKDSSLHSLGYNVVLEMFADANKEENSSVHAGVLVDTLYPLQRDVTRMPDVLDDSQLASVHSHPVESTVSQAKEDIVNTHVKPGVRASLRASLRVWQVLFLLWKHLLMRCPIDNLANVDEMFHALSSTAGSFLNTQRCRFTSLLESTDSMHRMTEEAERGCVGCGDGSSETCFHCGCTVCGQRRREEAAPVVVCAACGASTHVRCSKNVFTGEPIDLPGAGKRRKPNEFYCSVDCALGVTLVRNTRWCEPLSRHLEEEARSRWSEVQGLLACAEERALVVPAGVDEAAAANMQLRFEQWEQYFAEERLEVAHPLPIAPPFVRLETAAVEAAVRALLSPGGQARRLCGLDPEEYAIGSVAALPDKRRWAATATPVPSGKSNSFLQEARDLLWSAASLPTVVVEKDLSRLLSTKARAFPTSKPLCPAMNFCEFSTTFDKTRAAFAPSSGYDAPRIEATTAASLDIFFFCVNLTRAAGTVCTVYTPCGSFAVHFRSDGESTFLLHVRSCVMESTARDSAPPHSSADGDAAQLFSASLTPEAVEQITSAAGLRKNFRTFAEMTYNALIGSSTCLRFFVESPEALQRRIHEDVAQREAQRRDIETSSSPPAPAPALAAVPALSKPSAGDSDMLLTVDYDVDFTRAIFPLPLTKAPRSEGRSEGLRMEVRASVAHSPAEDREVVPARVDRTQHQLDRQHLAEALRLIQVLNGENATLKKENRMLAHLTREKMAEMQQLCKAFEEGAAAIAENIRLRMELQKAKEHVEEVEAAMSRLRRQTAVPCGSSRHISPSSRRSRAPLESRDVNLLPTHRHHHHEKASILGSQRRDRLLWRAALAGSGVGLAVVLRLAERIRHHHEGPRYQRALGPLTATGWVGRFSALSKFFCFSRSPACHGKEGVDRVSAPQQTPRIQFFDSSLYLVVRLQQLSRLSPVLMRLSFSPSLLSTFLNSEKKKYIPQASLAFQPPCLDEVVKLHLFEQATPMQVATIWNQHHLQFIQYWGRTISTAAYNAIEPRLRRCPYFVVPVFRDKGLFNVVTNFSDDVVGVAPLGEWQQKQDATSLHMTIQFFTELSRSKQLVLVRCEIKDEVFKRSDCLFVTQMLLKYYTLPSLFERWVETFNKKPNQFDYHAFLRSMKDDAGKDNIIIEDKKSDMRRDAYGPNYEKSAQLTVMMRIETTLTTHSNEKNNNIKQTNKQKKNTKQTNKQGLFPVFEIVIRSHAHTTTMACRHRVLGLSMLGLTLRHGLVSFFFIPPPPYFHPFLSGVDSISASIRVALTRIAGRDEREFVLLVPPLDPPYDWVRCRFGVELPYLFSGSFEEAKETAQRDAKYLIVCLHARYHEGGKELFQQVLCSEDVVTEFVERGIFFGACVEEAVGKKLAEQYNIETLPSLVVVFKNEVALDLSGRLTKEIVLEEWRKCTAVWDGIVAEELSFRVDQQQRQRAIEEEARRLEQIEQEDIERLEAFEKQKRESERREAERRRLEQQREEEAAARALAEQKEREAAEERAERAEKTKEEARRLLSEEPDAGEPDVVALRFRFATGGQETRRFRRTDAADQLLYFVRSRDAYNGSATIQLVMGYPPALLQWDEGAALGSLKGNGGLMTDAVDGEGHINLSRLLQECASPVSASLWERSTRLSRLLHPAPITLRSLLTHTN
eukprot:gene5263-3771_t